MNSEHAFVVFDIDMQTGDYTILFGTDRFGIRPLFFSFNEKCFCFASELISLATYDDQNATTFRFEPRNYGIVSKVNSVYSQIVYHEYYNLKNIQIDHKRSLEECLNGVRKLLEESVELRLSSDRDIGFFLSGGVDSSIVCSIASRIMKKYNKKIKTFCIGLDESPDVKFAEIVADYIGSDHTTVIVTEQQCLDTFYDLSKCIGSIDTTSHRASIYQYLLTKFIKENTDIKVMYSSDFSDEVNGSYLYFLKAPNEQAFHDECIRLLEEIHMFDSLRVDRTISNFGIECRVPYADYKLIEFILSCPIHFRVPQNGIEKWLLREAFVDDYLPREVLFRTKSAFSDGTSGQTRSWYEIIQEHVESLYTDEEFETKRKQYAHMIPETKEDLFYRELFCGHLGTNESIAKTIKHKWMPNPDWFEYKVTDPSARTLGIKEDA